MNKIAHHHSACSIIVNPTNDLILIGEYDQGYPRVSERGKINLVGGNYIQGDLSPKHTFEREIREEFTTEKSSKELETIVQDLSDAQNEHLVEGDFATTEEIDYIRKSVVENTKHYQDFLIGISDGRGNPISVVTSVFKTVLPEDFFVLVKSLLDSGKSINQEGLSRILNFEDIISLKVAAAYGAGKILSRYLGQKIPTYENIPCENLGRPLDSYKDYEKIFRYTHH